MIPCSACGRLTPKDAAVYIGQKTYQFCHPDFGPSCYEQYAPRLIAAAARRNARPTVRF